MLSHNLHNHIVQGMTSCLLLLAVLSACTGSRDERYAALDDAMTHRSEYMASKEKSIRLLESQLKGNDTDEARYQTYNQIFNEYLAYKADSARKYVDILCDIAVRMHNNEHINEAAINKSALLATSGFFDQSHNILTHLDKSTFTTATYRLYYENCRWLYITWSAYVTNDEIATHYQELVRAYNDSMITVVPRNDVDYYYWMGEHYWSHKQFAKAEQQYELGIERMSPLSRRYASITCSMALVGREQKKWDQFEKYMILSAIADQKIPLKENMAMQELAIFLATQCHDMSRANKYLLCSLEDAVFYNNRLRLTEIARKFPPVVVKYQEYEQRVKHGQTIIIIVATIFVLLLLVLAWYIYHSNQKLKAQRRIRIKLNEDLTAMNNRLNAMNTELAAANDNLKETNNVREKYVSLFIELCAAYIDKYNKFHRTIERKVKARQFDDLPTLLHQNRTKDVDTLEFFQNFDKAFLTLYPDFVNNFNALLQPDQQITLKNGELLTNELRIMALIRLGVTDTQKIATLLFYSTQTIYNYRSVMRQRAISPETFEQDVMVCG